MDDRVSDNDVIYYSEDFPSDAESISLKESVPTPTSDTNLCFKDDKIFSLSSCIGIFVSRISPPPLTMKSSYLDA